MLHMELLTPSLSFLQAPATRLHKRPQGGVASRPRCCLPLLEVGPAFRWTKAPTAEHLDLQAWLRWREHIVLNQSTWSVRRYCQGVSRILMVIFSFRIFRSRFPHSSIRMIKYKAVLNLFLLVENLPSSGPQSAYRFRSGIAWSLSLKLETLKNMVLADFLRVATYSQTVTLGTSQLRLLCARLSSRLSYNNRIHNFDSQFSVRQIDCDWRAQI